MADGRGGPRQALPGTPLTNRTDLARKPRLATGQPYGDKKAQAEALAAVPVPEPTALNAPSQFPDEPVTSGAPLGPGPGPEALASLAPMGPAAAPTDPIEAELRELYLAYPTEELRELIEDWDLR